MCYDGRIAYGQSGATGHTAHCVQFGIAIVHASNVRHVLMPTDGCCKRAQMLLCPAMYAIKSTRAAACVSVVAMFVWLYLCVCVSLLLLSYASKLRAVSLPCVNKSRLLSNNNNNNSSSSSGGNNEAT